MDQVLTWKSGHKVTLLPRGPPYPLHTILLVYLVRNNSPLQNVMVCFFIEFEARQRTMIICSQAAIIEFAAGLAKITHQDTIICSGLQCFRSA
jgi:hypothetical protein